MKEYCKALQVRLRSPSAIRSNSKGRSSDICLYQYWRHIRWPEKFDDALRQFQQAFDIYTFQLVAKDQKNALWQSNLAITLSQIGDVLIEAPDVEKARSSTESIEMLLISSRNFRKCQRGNFSWSVRVLTCVSILDARRL